MLWVPQKGELRVEHNMGAVGDSTPGTQIQTGAAASTKGSYVQVFAATAFDTYLIWVSGTGYSSSGLDSNLMADIAVGAATEEIIIPDLMLGGSQVGANSRRGYYFPLYIPAGTRIAARAAGERVSQVSGLQIALYGGDGVPPFRVGRKVTTYGVTTVPNGTTIVPGASGAAGSFTEIVASTSEDHFAVSPGFHPGVDISKGNLSYCAAIGLGAATEEEIGQWLFGTTNLEVQAGPMPEFPVFTDIPSGTRMAMRFSNSGANDTGDYNGCIYAVS